MRVALDATPLMLSSGGLRRYTEELSIALAAEYPADCYTLISNQSFTSVTGIPRATPPRHWAERRWWLFGANLAMDRLHAGVFHGTNFEVPYLNSHPSVVTIHDLSPWKNPAWHHNANRVRSRTPWLLRLGLATMIVTPTNAIRREVIQFFRLSPDRVVAVPHGAGRLSRPPETELGQQPQERPYFLFVGTLEPRKNLHMLIEAWRSVRAEADLVIAGRRRLDGPVFHPEPGLRMLGEIADSELPMLFARAAAFVYPSFYEGFGLPVLEAMQCGAPVITSSDPALMEIGGDATLRADSAPALAETMRALLARPELRQEYRNRSLARARAFSWSKTARATHAVYEEAIARFA